MTVVRIGFVPLVDCAPLVVAQEKGLFAKQGLQVELHKAQSWDQLVQWLASGEVEAAHMLITAPLQWALHPGGADNPLVYAVSLGSHGNCITVSNALWRDGVHDPAGLRTRIANGSGGRMLKFAVVHPRSTHEYLLRLWFSRAGLELGRDVALSYVAPHEMVHALREGIIDGFCAGEPWNQRAVSSRLGYIAATSCDVLPPMNEKVLAVRETWHRHNEDVHAALVRAVVAAGHWLSRPENLDETVDLVSGKRFVNTTPTPVRAALSGAIEAGGRRVLSPPGFLRFSGHGCNYPDPNHARFYLECMWHAGHVTAPQSNDLDLGAICLDGFFRDAMSVGGPDFFGEAPDGGASYSEFLERIPVFPRR